MHCVLLLILGRNDVRVSVDNIGSTFVLITLCPKKYAHGFVVLCFVVVMQSFIMNSHEVFIHIHLGCFAGTGAIVRLPQCQWSKLDEYGKISQCITTTKQKPCAYFLGYTVHYDSVAPFMRFRPIGGWVYLDLCPTLGLATTFLTNISVIYGLLSWLWFPQNGCVNIMECQERL